jgi:four helix bundle protein
MKTPYDIQDRSFLFACRIVDFCKPLFGPPTVLRELSRQLIRAGTSVGANLEEAEAGQTKPDFRTKVAISRKEAREARYWRRLIAHAEPRLNIQVAPLIDEARQIVQILTAIKKSAETNGNRG